MKKQQKDPLTLAKNPLTPAKDPSPDKGVFIGFRYDGTEIRSKGLPVETVKQLIAIAQECQHIVDRKCTFQAFDSKDGEDTIADYIRSSQAIGECPDKRTGIFYGVGTSGAAASNASNKPPPFSQRSF